jgi:TolA-binding protein
MFTGGDRPPEPEPNYSTALARRQQGLYRDALYEIQAQLTQFPQDPAGQLLMAEVQAENLKDLVAAEVTIRKLCAQPAQTRGTISLAWNSLADWHLSVGRDVDAARTALQQIIIALPNTEQAMQAEQRLAHLPDPERLENKDAPKTIPMREGVKNVGLKKVTAEDIIHRKTPAEEADDLVQHLTDYPLDTEARERLATLYAEDLGQFDLAIEQIEQMAGHPSLSAKQVVHLLHKLADFHVRFGNNLEQGRAALQRIIDRFPNTAHAVQAQTRMFTLGNELLKPEPAHVKLGVYDRYLGLKKKSAAPD